MQRLIDSIANLTCLGHVRKFKTLYQIGTSNRKKTSMVLGCFCGLMWKGLKTFEQFNLSGFFFCAIGYHVENIPEIIKVKILSWSTCQALHSMVALSLSNPSAGKKIFSVPEVRPCHP